MAEEIIPTYKETGMFDDYLNNTESILVLRNNYETREKELLSGRADSLFLPNYSFWGRVNSNGTKGSPFPNGWKSENLAAGRYKITHNLGNTNYVVVASALSGNETNELVFARNDNDFEIRFFNNVNSLTNTDFMFIVLI